MKNITGQKWAAKIKGNECVDLKNKTQRKQRFTDFIATTLTLSADTACGC